MTLATHITIAAAVTKPLASFNPVFTFVAAVASHYLSDAIPHWDYPLLSVADNEDPEKKRWSFTKRSFLTDLSRVAFDGLLGATIVTLLIWPNTTKEVLYVLSVIIGGALPDFLEALYHTRRPELQFIKPLSRFHQKIHTKIKLGPYPLIGIPLQLIILALSILFIV